MKKVDSAKKWVADFVIARSLCPFARVPYEAGIVRFCEVSEVKIEGILSVFWKEIELIDAAEPSELSNSILVIPALSHSFEEYLDVFYMMTDLLELQEKSHEFQLASFHPLYLFEGTTEDDPTNYTNRSPLPFVHILRTDEVTKAIEAHPDIDSIPAANQEKMRELGVDRLRRYLGSFT